ncbi:BnaC09g14140D [Brassica napus]|uniref:BnaC09g14140D protein n=1 Tax=Brassica napus TaxID=3708 RepID=A0A078I7U8_BRANA|nr:BnaC09g14140D [Brassica napus]
MGIVESIEYDPNRSSQIAPVRWIKGGCQKKMNTIEELAPPRKILEPTTNTISGLFSFSFLPGKVDQRKVACISPGLMARLCSGRPSYRNASFVFDVFFSAFSSPKAKRETASLAFASSFGFPRIAVAGVPTAFFAPRMRQKVRGKSTFSLCEVRKWRTNSILWAHRIKGKAGLSWQSFRRQDTLGLVGAAGHNKSKPKMDQGSLPAKPIGERAKQLKALRGLKAKDGACKVDLTREERSNGKAIRPFGSSRSIAHIQISYLIGERGNTHEAPAEREGLPGRMPMGAGFFEKTGADSETWDLGLATNEYFSSSFLCQRLM